MKTADSVRVRLWQRRHPSHGLAPGSAQALTQNKSWTPQCQRTRTWKHNNTISKYGDTFWGRQPAQWQLLLSLNNRKSDPLEIQHPKLETTNKSWLSLFMKWQIRHPSRCLVPGWAQLCSQIKVGPGPENVNITSLYRCRLRLLKATTRRNDSFSDL